MSVHLFLSKVPEPFVVDPGEYVRRRADVIRFDYAWVETRKIQSPDGTSLVAGDRYQHGGTDVRIRSLDNFRVDQHPGFVRFMDLMASHAERGGVRTRGGGGTLAVGGVFTMQENTRIC